MPATRDKSQKITFVYSNLYAIYRKGVERAREGAIHESAQASPSVAAEALTELAVGRTSTSTSSPSGPSMRAPFESGVVIKARDLKSPLPPISPPTAPRVTEYTPAELLGKRLARPASLPAAVAAPASAPSARPAQATPEAVASLKQNLQSLNDLQARLRFMLKELEELTKE